MAPARTIDDMVENLAGLKDIILELKDAVPKKTTPKTETNGVVVTNGKADSDKSKGEEKEKKDEKPIKVGMECTAKTLYQGKEDDHGNFEWLETIPEDLGEAKEGDKTAKFALLVRYLRVYNDPTRVIQLHSIVVQSPHLKTILKSVLKGYPGVALSLQRLELSGRFQSIVHRWPQLTQAISELKDDKPEEAEKKQHAELLVKVLEPELSETINTSRDLISKGLITYEYLWTLFYPSSFVFTKRDGHERALKLSSAKFGHDCQGQPCFYVRASFIDWNGSMFGTTSINIKIGRFTGTRKITSLAVYPLDHHAEKDELTKRLIERGTKWSSLAGFHFKAFDGTGWDPQEKEKVRVKGRIVIDGQGWQDHMPGFATRVSPLLAPKSDSDDEDEDDDFVDDLAGEDDYGISVFQIGRSDDEDDDQDNMPPKPLTDEQKLITTPVIRGYSLANKSWLEFDVSCAYEIKFNERAFERLVLPEKQKELILGFTESQTKYKDEFDDIMQGKGKGIILLLCGPPGVGKSLTAESVAEEMRVPLYSVTAGDLGIGSYDVEGKLKSIMEMCARWGAVLLIDEADVFLEERSLHELERNKLVTIFLRMIEWYEGIMFLTTNRVNTFDKAFQSRIHISLDYPDLSTESRKMVWKNFLDNLQQKNNITESQLKQLAQMQMNGRQIKNVLKTAQLLARRKDNVLSHQHVLTVLDVTQHLHNSNQENERSRASVYC